MSAQSPRCSPDSGEFAGLVAIVTGGTSGIGEEVVDQLIAKGARVAALGTNLSHVPANVHPVHCDVRDAASVTAAIDDVVRTFGAIDILVNNAGVSCQGTVESITDEEWLQVFDVNVFGLARVTRAALPHLTNSSHAAIVNVCSVVASVGLSERAGYAATKGAVHSLTTAMATDHLAEGIRVNCVHPGTVASPWLNRLLATADDAGAERESLRARQPHGRFVTVGEIAHAVTHLASPLAGSTTGTSLTVDGGLTTLRPRGAAQTATA
jgi:2-keto-3-deoxy-L-fuconate dehydrogenase